MNKYSKVSTSKIIMIVVFAVLIVAAVALLLMIFSDSLRQDRLRSDMDESVMFGVCSGDVNKVELSDDLVSVSYLENYNAEVRNITSGYYLDILRKNGEKEAISLYNAILYAYNNEMNYISLPAKDYPEETMVKALYFATCDLPIVDINDVSLSAVDSSVTLDDGTVSVRHYLYLPTGGKGYISKKKSAIDAAQKIVDSIPKDCETELAKAEYLHDWLVTNVKVTDDPIYALEKPHYLYDVFMTKSTDYTGFSQAYSLLLNLTGIEGFRVIQNAEKAEEYAWNIVNVDGTYYQTDCTADAKLCTIGLDNFKLHFCISAQAMENGKYQKILREITPACDATDRDAGRIDLDFGDKVLEWTDQNSDGVKAVMKKLEDGAPYVTLRAKKFNEYKWEDNVAFIEYWFDVCTVEFEVVPVGKYVCLVYPSAQVLR
ncbi:MAG: hypothetical protein IJC46_09605 [Clostridia bacterium]|nr:hypothetical protein [Clostridia bacterium]